MVAAVGFSDILAENPDGSACHDLLGDLRGLSNCPPSPAQDVTYSPGVQDIKIWPAHLSLKAKNKEVLHASSTPVPPMDSMPTGVSFASPDISQGKGKGRGKGKGKGKGKGEQHWDDHYHEDDWGGRGRPSDWREPPRYAAKCHMIQEGGGIDLSKGGELVPLATYMEVDGSSPRHESENEGDISNRGPFLHVGQGFEGVPRGKDLIPEMCGPTEKNMVSALELAIEANSTAQATCNILSPAVARIQEQTDSMAQSIEGLVSDGDQTHYQVLALRSRLEAVERSLETLRECSDRSQERGQNLQNAPPPQLAQYEALLSQFGQQSQNLAGSLTALRENFASRLNALEAQVCSPSPDLQRELGQLGKIVQSLQHEYQVQAKPLIESLAMQQVKIGERFVTLEGNVLSSSSKNMQGEMAQRLSRVEIHCSRLESGTLSHEDRLDAVASEIQRLRSDSSAIWREITTISQKNKRN